MNISSLSKRKLIILGYILFIVFMTILSKNELLTAGGIVTGIIFMFVFKKLSRVRTKDERTENIAGKAATHTVFIMTTALGFISLIMFFVFRNEPYLKNLAIVFSYIVLSIFIVYSLLYKAYTNEQS